MKNILIIILMTLYLFKGIVIGLGTDYGVFGGLIIMIIIRYLSCIYYYYNPFSKKRFIWITILLFFLITIVTPKHISEKGNQEIDKWQEEQSNKVG